MSGKMELNISESTLAELCCSICKGYLSCPPIRILPDGGNICGRCSPPNTDVPTYVQFSLEAIMRDATFPCIFHQNGCKIRLPFGYASINNHEAECAYRNGPETSKPGCSTETPQEEVIKDTSTSETLQEEVIKDTTTFVLHNAELTLKLDEDKTTVPAQDGSKVINPFNVRKASRAASIVSLRQWNGYANSPPYSPRANSWNGSAHNSYDPNHYQSYYDRNWNSYNNTYRRRYNNNRRNDVVIIKGQTVYVTL